MLGSGQGPSLVQMIGYSVTIALCTLSSNISAPRQKFEKMPRMLGFSVPHDPMQKYAFHYTWFSKK